MVDNFVYVCILSLVVCFVNIRQTEVLFFVYFMFIMIKRGNKIMNLGNKVKTRREELGLSQEKLAFMMGYKSKTSISKIENGREVSHKVISKLARALNTSPTYLMGWDDPNTVIQKLDQPYCNESLDSSFKVHEQDFIYMPENKSQKPVIISVRDQKIQRATELLQKYSDDDLRLALEMLEKISPKEK